jgi:hypothetical protein
MAGGNVPGLKGKIFKKALETKLERLHTTGEVTHPFWDRIVFRKVRASPVILILLLLNSFSDPKSSWGPASACHKWFSTY